MGIRELVIEQARQKGFKEGLEIGKSQAIKSLLTQTKLTIPQIAEIVDVTESFVQNISNDLK